MKKKVFIEAPFRSVSGYGVHARLVMRSFRAQQDKFEIYAVPLTWGKTSWDFQDTEENRWFEHIIHKTQHAIKQGNFKPDIHVHVGIPSEFTRKADHAVCVTAGIETTAVSPEWIRKTYEMSKIVVPSEHAQAGFFSVKYPAKDQTGRAFEAACHCPVEVVPYPVKAAREDRKFKLDVDTNFNFLVVAQNSIRKNMVNTIHGFVEQFKDNPDVGLILKTSHTNGSIPDRYMTQAWLDGVLANFSDRKCKVYLIHGDLTEGEMKALYQHKSVKAIVSTTHGEGFGLPLFEAACNALPVIATGWSAHTEFLSAPVKNKKGRVRKKELYGAIGYDLKPIQKEAVWDGILIPTSLWAYPRQDSYKKLLQDCFDNISSYESDARALRKHLLKRHEEGRIYKEMVAAILDETPDEDIEDL